MKVTLVFDNGDTYDYDGAPQEAISCIRHHMDAEPAMTIPGELMAWGNLWRRSVDYVMTLSRPNSFRRVEIIPDGAMNSVYIAAVQPFSPGELLQVPQERPAVTMSSFNQSYSDWVANTNNLRAYAEPTR